MLHSLSSFRAEKWYSFKSSMLCCTTGNVDLSDLLLSMDSEVAKAKEQASSRKDILDKVEKWKHAAEEENWLDEYERVKLAKSYISYLRFSLSITYFLIVDLYYIIK